MSKRQRVLIRNARLCDGTGAPPVDADLAVEGERISAIGSLSGDAEVEIDAQGLALAPGFIDVHTHDDFAAVVYPEMAFKVQGGVTTCVVGNCGMGAAPYHQASRMARAFHPNQELPEWQGYSGYLGWLDAHRPSVNIGALVGHGTLRAAVMGGEAREPSGDELDAMKGLLDEGLAAGALGLSTGLIYEPGRHAKTDEIVELARELSQCGGLYTTHMRNEGPGLLDSVDEAIEIGERAGVPVQISHHKASGRESWGQVTESLERIAAAQARGVSVHADQYPYTAGSTVLAAIAQNDGFGGSGGVGKVDPADVVISSTENHSEWHGRSIADFVSEWELAAPQAAERVLAEEPLATIIMHSMSEDDVQTVMRHPSTMIGSDGIPSMDGNPHPRLYGSFARVLGRYSRELGIFPMEEAVHRMTGFPARVFGLAGRGELTEGAFADLVLFDPEEIIDRGTYEAPHATPAGIQHVFVNGGHVVRDGEHTGERSGAALRRA
ncbi:MAG: D-aminoacylase [bacterium]|nr:D-aminoacylase [bacterium]